MKLQRLVRGASLGLGPPRGGAPLLDVPVEALVQRGGEQEARLPRALAPKPSGKVWSPGRFSWTASRALLQCAGHGRKARDD